MSGASARIAKNERTNEVREEDNWLKARLLSGSLLDGIEFEQGGKPPEYPPHITDMINSFALDLRRDTAEESNNSEYVSSKKIIPVFFFFFQKKKLSQKTEVDLRLF